MARWYPNGDGDKCSGSFKTAIYAVDRDGKVECGACGRRIGLRNPRTKQLAQHRLPNEQVPPCHVDGKLVVYYKPEEKPNGGQ